LNCRIGRPPLAALYGDAAPLPTVPQDLPATGERTAPGLPREEYWFARHLAAYEWCAGQIAPEGILIDAGAGEGYGIDLLRGRLRIAIDYDAATCAHIHDHYLDVAAVRANLIALPLPTGSVDAVVTLQVLEHMWDPLAFLREVRRIVTAGGRVLLSTPNRLTFSPGLARGEKPTNPFHVEEYDAQQVYALLHHAGFSDIAVHGLHHGDRLRAWEAQRGSIVAAQVAALTTDDWPQELHAMVSSVTPADFVHMADVDSAEDLIAVGIAR
jgi:SAM-dependent methyltransferase